MQSAHPLKSYRQSQNPKLSQAELAGRLGVARLTVLRWETGERNIDPRLLPRVCEQTGISAKELRPDLAKQFSDEAESAA